METNVLYYGDNLNILRHRDEHGDHDYFPNDSVDLIYLDPPFNSQQSYNVLFKENDTSWAPASLKAFGDTWHWGPDAERTYRDLLMNGPTKIAQLLGALIGEPEHPGGIGRNDATAYLVMMTTRLIELHRVLKPTGSLYLHCDPTMSHYIKLVLDQIFSPVNFRNEIVWKRTHAHSGGRKLGAVHDVILFYSKSDGYVWNTQRVGYSEKYIETFFRFQDPDRQRYQATILTGSGTRTGSSGKPWRGIDPTKSGRHWAIPGYVRPLLGAEEFPDVQSALDELDKIGRILWPAKPGGIPRFKQYQADMEGTEVQDVWIDIPPISSQAEERLGYPTQKPEALLERIVKLNSNEGDIILDPFCGCGTALVAAHKLNRRWVGIDITHLAIGVTRKRLQEHFPGIQVKVIGEPEDLPSAQALAKQDRYQFQWWAISRIGARPLGEKKKGADKGIDGVIPFDDTPGGKLKRAVVSVKSGNVGVPALRELIGVGETNKDPIGIFLTLHSPTQPMITEASAAGFYHSDLWQKDFPRIQILTIEAVFQGELPEIPPSAPPPKAPSFEKVIKNGKSAMSRELEKPFPQLEISL